MCMCAIVNPMERRAVWVRNRKKKKYSIIYNLKMSRQWLNLDGKNKIKMDKLAHCQCECWCCTCMPPPSTADAAKAKARKIVFNQMLNQIQTIIPLLPIVLQSKRFVLAYSNETLEWIQLFCWWESCRYFVWFDPWRLSIRCMCIIKSEYHTICSGHQHSMTAYTRRKSGKQTAIKCGEYTAST